jgi:copper(I)-binding protein
LLKPPLAFAASLLIAAAAFAQSPAVEVRQAWARATPGKAENSAAYLSIRSATTDRITRVSTPIAKKAELHSASTEGGIMNMRPLGDLDLPAGQAVTLKPGGAHIMLFGLTEPLRAGQSFPLTLQLEKAGPQDVTVAVEPLSSTGPDKATGGGAPMPAGR